MLRCKVSAKLKELQNANLAEAAEEMKAGKWYLNRIPAAPKLRDTIYFVVSQQIRMKPSSIKAENVKHSETTFETCDQASPSGLLTRIPLASSVFYNCSDEVIQPIVLYILSPS